MKKRQHQLKNRILFATVPVPIAIAKGSLRIRKYVHRVGARVAKTKSPVHLPVDLTVKFDFSF